MKNLNVKNPKAITTDTWLTDPRIIEAVGPFDLDPCTPPGMPWATADYHLTEADDGLTHFWQGNVWLNPPYSDIEPWLQKLADHGRGIALLFARTDTGYFHRQVWPRADGILFLRGRLTFYHADGTKAKGNAGAPSCLIAYGQANANRLRLSGLEGKYITLFPEV